MSTVKIVTRKPMLSLCHRCFTQQYNSCLITLCFLFKPGNKACHITVAHSQYVMVYSYWLKSIRPGLVLLLVSDVCSNSNVNKVN